jgi:adenosylcobinamide-GDP ribazoletransferase
VHGGNRPAAAVTHARRGRRGPPGPPGAPGYLGRPRSAVTPGSRARSWPAGPAALRVALSLFSAIPVRAVPGISRDDAARAVLWLPVVGALLAVPAAGVLLAVEAGGHTTPRELLAAALAVGVLALLTGGLHLDGLADTADGLGSRRPRDEALAIMRRSDVGPFGVAALLLVLLVQVTALATVRPGWPAAAALVTAVVTGRVAVLLAAGSRTPAARPDGFGALVASSTSLMARVTAVAALLAAVAGTAVLAWGQSAALRGVAAVLAGLVAAGLLHGAARRRLGGMTGDVFGAVAEIATAAALMTLALTS